MRRRACAGSAAEMCRSRAPSSVRSCQTSLAIGSNPKVPAALEAVCHAALTAAARWVSCSTNQAPHRRPWGEGEAKSRSNTSRSVPTPVNKESKPTDEGGGGDGASIALVTWGTVGMGGAARGERAPGGEAANLGRGRRRGNRRRRSTETPTRRQEASPGGDRERREDGAGAIEVPGWTLEATSNGLGDRPSDGKGAERRPAAPSAGGGSPEPMAGPCKGGTARRRGPEARGSGRAPASNVSAEQQTRGD